MRESVCNPSSSAAIIPAASLGGPPGLGGGHCQAGGRAGKAWILFQGLESGPVDSLCCGTRSALRSSCVAAGIYGRSYSRDEAGKLFPKPPAADKLLERTALRQVYPRSVPQASHGCSTCCVKVVYAANLGRMTFFLSGRTARRCTCHFTNVACSRVSVYSIVVACLGYGLKLTNSKLRETDKRAGTTTFIHVQFVVLLHMEWSSLGSLREMPSCQG